MRLSGTKQFQEDRQQKASPQAQAGLVHMKSSEEASGWEWVRWAGGEGPGFYLEEDGEGHELIKREN